MSLLPSTSSGNFDAPPADHLKASQGKVSPVSASPATSSPSSDKKRVVFNVNNKGTQDDGPAKVGSPSAEGNEAAHPPKPPPVIETTCKKSNGAKNKPGGGASSSSVLSLKDALEINRAHRPQNFTVTYNPPRLRRSTRLFMKILSAFLILGVLAGAITVLVVVNGMSNDEDVGRYGTAVSPLLRVDMNLTAHPPERVHASEFSRVFASGAHVYVTQVVLEYLNPVPPSDTLEVYFVIRNLTSADAVGIAQGYLQAALVSNTSIVRRTYSFTGLTLWNNVSKPEAPWHPTEAPTPPPGTPEPTWPVSPTPTPTFFVNDVLCSFPAYAGHACAGGLVLDSIGRCQCTSGLVCKSNACVAPKWSCADPLAPVATPAPSIINATPVPTQPPDYLNLTLRASYPACNPYSVAQCEAVCVADPSCLGFYYDQRKPLSTACYFKKYPHRGYGVSALPPDSERLPYCSLDARRVLASIVIPRQLHDSAVGEAQLVSISINATISGRVKLVLYVIPNTTAVTIINTSASVTVQYPADVVTYNVSASSAGTYKFGVYVEGVAMSEIMPLTSSTTLAVHAHAARYITVSSSAIPSHASTSRLVGELGERSTLALSLSALPATPGHSINLTLSASNSDLFDFVPRTVSWYAGDTSLTRYVALVGLQPTWSPENVTFVVATTSTALTPVAAPAPIEVAVHTADYWRMMTYNLAPLGTARQSSTAANCASCGASAANQTKWDGSSFSMTSFSPLDLAPWWEVRFPKGPYVIRNVFIMNREVNSYRLQNITIEAYLYGAKVAVSGVLNEANVLDSPLNLSHTFRAGFVLCDRVVIRKSNALTNGVDTTLALVHVSINGTDYDPALGYAPAVTIEPPEEDSVYFSPYSVNVMGYSTATLQSTTQCASCAAAVAADGMVCLNSTATVTTEPQRTMTAVSPTLDRLPWWRVDFGPNLLPLHKVRLYNRWDCCSERLVDVLITVWNASVPGAPVPYAVSVYNTTTTLSATSRTSTDPSLVEHEFPIGVPGNRVVIFKTTLEGVSNLTDAGSATNVLSLAEVEVYAYVSPGLGLGNATMRALVGM
eukprot:PhM_4_TR1718/c0_g1_i1/m.89966